MNMNRLMSRREKNGEGNMHRRDKSRDKSSDKKNRPLSGDGLKALFRTDPQKKLDKEQSTKVTTLGPDGPGSADDPKVATLKKKLKDLGCSEMDEEQINYALNSRHANGDVDKACEMLVLFQESVEGKIKPYNPVIHMNGAENREGVTCYIDALLFAMFARLGSFEILLRREFEDEPLRRLSTLIRLWVNMLRTGKLVQTDVTQYLQEALSACGWPDAAELHQQDTSEAFGFITDKLELPLLKMTVDLFHTGAGDDPDDHKMIEERLLDVAVPDIPKPDGSTGPARVKLEECMEGYFNNRVEVVRHLEVLRRNTLERTNTASSSRPSYRPGQIHTEIREVDGAETPTTPTSVQTPVSPISPGRLRLRGTSILQTVVVDENGKEKEDLPYSDGDDKNGEERVRREVLMPAWQFFNLIPWHTDSRNNDAPTTDEEVAARFAQEKPVLGICLKRYGMTESGQSYKKDTIIDIPTELRLPHFTGDEGEEGTFQGGDFRLSLQSVICHRGQTVQSGHYFSYIRGSTIVADGDSHSSQILDDHNVPPGYSEERWIKFDDLSNPRVRYADISEAIETAEPYLLFYQVQPLDISPPASDQVDFSSPPSYVASRTDLAAALEANISAIQAADDSIISTQTTPQNPGYFDRADEITPMPTIKLFTESPSAEVDRRQSDPRSSVTLPSTNGTGRRDSVFTESSLASTASSMLDGKGVQNQAVSAPGTPSEETTAQRMSRAAARFTGKSKSRPTSQSGESRISMSLVRGLNMMRSKDSLSKESLTKGGASLGPKDIPKLETHIARGSFDSQRERAVESRPSVTIDETSLWPVSPEKEKSKREKKEEKKRDRSKGPKDKDREKEHHLKSKGKNKARDVPERECVIM